MRRTRRLFTAAVAIGAIVGTTAAFAAIAPPSLAPKAPVKPECKGVPVCDPFEGPWVLVPATGQVEYLVQCHARADVVAGTDAPTSAKDIRVTFDAFMGSPVAPKSHTTAGFALFHAVSIDGHAGAFKPAIGCIPKKGGGHSNHSTLSARVKKAIPNGAPKSTVAVPLDAWVKNVNLVPGATQRATTTCTALPVEATKTYEHRVAGLDWWSLAFNLAPGLPPPTSSQAASALSAVDVTLSAHGDVVAALIKSETAGFTPEDAPEVQVGVVCAN